MKKIFLAILLLMSLFACSLNVEEVITRKEGVSDYNYVLVTAIDDSEQYVDIEYSKTLDMKTNILVRERHKTPFVFGGHKVVIQYDSVNVVNNYNKKVLDTGRRLVRNFDNLGSDYLRISNQSSPVDIEYAIIDNSKILAFQSSDKMVIKNKSEMKSTNIIQSSPAPLYKGCPILYLLKPELAPNKLYYYMEYTGKEDIGHFELYDLFMREMPLFKDKVGEFSDLPFSITKIMNLYRDEYNMTEILYKDYKALETPFSMRDHRSIAMRSDYYSLYGKIKAGEVYKQSEKSQFSLIPKGDILFTTPIFY